MAYYKIVYCNKILNYKLILKWYIVIKMVYYYIKWYIII